MNRLTVGIDHGTVKACRSSVARYIDVVPRYGSRRGIPGERRRGFANDLDRRVRRSNDAEPNREQCTPPENLAVGNERPEERNQAVSCGGISRGSFVYFGKATVGFVIRLTRVQICSRIRAASPNVDQTSSASTARTVDAGTACYDSILC